MHDAVAALRERGTTAGGINGYIRGINVFINGLHGEYAFDGLSIKLMRGDKRILRVLTDQELKSIQLQRRGRDDFDTDERLSLL